MDVLTTYLIFKVLINAFIGATVIEDFDGSRDISSASTIDLIRLSHTKIASNTLYHHLMLSRVSIYCGPRRCPLSYLFSLTTVNKPLGKAPIASAKA